MSQEEVLRENKVLEQLARDDFSIKEQQGRSRLNASIQLSANYKAQMQTLQSKMAVLPFVTCQFVQPRKSGNLVTSQRCALHRYAEVYAVFNNKNFWVNMQWREENNVNVINRDPTRITFNMGLPGTENEWLPFVTPERGSGSIAPCYIPRSLSARLPLDQARELEERALAELVSGLENIRSVVNATTVLANEASPGMVKYVCDSVLLQQQTCIALKPRCCTVIETQVGAGCFGSKVCARQLVGGSSCSCSTRMDWLALSSAGVLEASHSAYGTTAGELLDAHAGCAACHIDAVNSSRRSHCNLLYRLRK